MTWIMNVPVLLKILVSLLLIITLNRKLSNQFIAICAGTLVLAFWAGHSPASAAEVAAARLGNPDNILLLIVISTIIALSSQMKECGIMDDLVRKLTASFSNIVSMAVLPAVIGLLPMPGGAVFSAPLVDKCDGSTKVDPLLKSQINYWFRHIWEYWWPLYPGVLLAIEISGLSVGQFMLYLFPVSIVSAAGASFFLLRKAAPALKEPEEGCEDDVDSSILFLLSPILIVIGCYAVINTFLPAVGGFSRYLPILSGIVLSIVYLQIIRPVKAECWKKIILSKKLIMLVLLVAAIRVYGAFIEGGVPGGELLMDLLRSELAAAGISPYFLIMLVPFFCGVSTGIAIGTVGAAFPIVMSILGPDPSYAQLISTTALAYSFGHVGQLMSPVHVCLLVSNDYFEVGLGKSMAGLIKPTIVVLTAGFLLSRLYLAVL